MIEIEYTNINAVALKGRNSLAQGNAHRFIHIFSLKCMNEM